MAKRKGAGELTRPNNATEEGRLAGECHLQQQQQYNSQWWHQRHLQWQRDNPRWWHQPSESCDTETLSIIAELDTLITTLKEDIRKDERAKERVQKKEEKAVQTLKKAILVKNRASKDSDENKELAESALEEAAKSCLELEEEIEKILSIISTKYKMLHLLETQKTSNNNPSLLLELEKEYLQLQQELQQRNLHLIQQPLAPPKKDLTIEELIQEIRELSKKEDALQGKIYTEELDEAIQRKKNYIENIGDWLKESEKLEKSQETNPKVTSTISQFLRQKEHELIELGEKVIKAISERLAGQKEKTQALKEKRRSISS